MDPYFVFFVTLIGNIIYVYLILHIVQMPGHDLFDVDLLNLSGLCSPHDKVIDVITINEMQYDDQIEMWYII